MNDLFSGSFSRASPSPRHHSSIELSSSSGAASVNLSKFFEDVESIKEDLAELDRLRDSLRSSHERSKTLHDSRSVRELRSRMEGDVSSALKKAKLTKVRLEALDRANAANRGVPGCGPGSSSDRTRTSVVNGLRKKLRDAMEEFGALRERISGEYRETVQRRYFTVTGENPDEKTLDLLISTGGARRFCRKRSRSKVEGGSWILYTKSRRGTTRSKTWSGTSRSCTRCSWTWLCWCRRRASSWMASRARSRGLIRSSVVVRSGYRPQGRTRRTRGSGLTMALFFCWRSSCSWFFSPSSRGKITAEARAARHLLCGPRHRHLKLESSAFCPG